ncbi:hypothetical protein BABINDRAFT_32812 [Babjeviella inositovora NRRL Y-12698]|uniref:TLC domain-containing protein n=1 Tax=Babjeviella inositovora NRRL Y-12698 TaxID=984486 RepID=A0A1E3QUU1_9ASCO|nr:uncharacterized protein BABINDRAFT_32812 [Babjeviella inositovora NRRL Y-12698]ODQ81463.1 hypothetical protein BABINDRAFT_32812 [Babjeviella inositovora NRRL Y-12698]
MNSSSYYTEKALKAPKYTEKEQEVIEAGIERSQLKYSAAILLTLLSLHRVPRLEPYTSKFLYLQNQTGTNPATYDTHIDDVYFVMTWIVLLVFIRSILMDYLFKPIARAYNINSAKALTRFAEQGWSFTYYSISWGVGMWLYVRSNYWLDCDNIFRGWPHQTFSVAFKSYYLIQIACWLQQIFVLNVEEKRKDYVQMFSHHIITCILCIGSYYKHFTNIGHVILVIMDLVDIFLAAAKMLKYLGYSTACDVMFILFMVSWIILRHGVYNYILWHASTRLFMLMAPRHCSLATDPDMFCFVDWDVKIFLWLLAGLQVITLIWMYMIARVAYKVITGSGAEDVRSDEDDTDNEAGSTDISDDDEETAIDSENESKLKN